eukprot:5158589-Pyramimonas_sp.AAC.1
MAEDTKCAMCFARYSLYPCTALPCGHAFHTDCIERHMAVLAESRLPARLSPEEEWMSYPCPKCKTLPRDLAGVEAALAAQAEDAAEDAPLAQQPQGIAAEG